MLKKISLFLFLFAPLIVTGCESGSENTVVDQSEADKYNIPPGEMEKAMAEAAKGPQGNR